MVGDPAELCDDGREVDLDVGPCCVAGPGAADVGFARVCLAAGDRDAFVGPAGVGLEWYILGDDVCEGLGREATPDGSVHLGHVQCCP